jgi:hypothetical protein
LLQLHPFLNKQGPEFFNCLLVCCPKTKIRIYETIILPMILPGCETWSLILREEHRLRVFEKRVLRKIFGPKRDNVRGGWRKLHEELHNLYSFPSIMEDEMGGACSTHGGECI